MKISEIILEGRGNTETLKQYTDRLLKNKIQRLGLGGFASVWQHPYYTNVAVKVVVNDPHYMRYLKFIAEHPNNKYVPQIIPQDGHMFSTHNLRGDRNDPYMPSKVHVVFMKRYDRVNKNIKIMLIQELFDDWSSYLDGWNLYAHRNKPMLWRKLANVRDFHEDDPDAAQLARFLSNQAKGTIDLFPKNFMYDTERRQLIFSDPVGWMDL